MGEVEWTSVNLLSRKNLHVFQKKIEIDIIPVYVLWWYCIILLFFLKKGVLGKIVLSCLRVTVPIYSIPFTKFPQEVLGNRKQKY